MPTQRSPAVLHVQAGGRSLQRAVCGFVGETATIERLDLVCQPAGQGDRLYLLGLEFAGDLTAKVDDRLAFYGQAGYQFAVSETTAGVARNAVMADVGLRYHW